MKIEILTNNKIKYAFQELGIKGTRTYKGSKEPFYEVWEIEKSDLTTLEEYVGWPDKWGWWRYAKGSNMGTACSFFAVNDFELIAWDGEKRDGLRDEWDEMSIEERASYHYSFREYEKERMPHKYDSLLEYLSGELETTSPRNICPLAIDLARTNGLSMAELFQMYEG